MYTSKCHILFAKMDGQRTTMHNIRMWGKATLGVCTNTEWKPQYTYLCPHSMQAEVWTYLLDKDKTSYVGKLIQIN